MPHDEWEGLFFTRSEFHQYYLTCDNYNDEINRNSPSRDPGISFSQFVDEGSDILIQKYPDIVMQLI